MHTYILYVCMYGFIQKTYACMYVPVCMHVCMCVCMCVCMYALTAEIVFSLAHSYLDLSLNSRALPLCMYACV